MWVPPFARVEYAEAMSSGVTPSPMPPMAVGG